MNHHPVVPGAQPFARCSPGGQPNRTLPLRSFWEGRDSGVHVCAHSSWGDELVCYLLYPSQPYWDVGVSTPLLQKTWDPVWVSDPHGPREAKAVQIFPQTPRCPGSQALGALCWPWEARQHPGWQPTESNILSSTSLSLRSNSSLPLHNPSSFLHPTLQADYPHPSLSATSLLVQVMALSSLGSCYSLFTMYRPLSQSLLPERRFRTQLLFVLSPALKPSPLLTCSQEPAVRGLC